jgi:predicted nucleic acid-binding protein
MTDARGYCVDTSALIDLWRRRYPRDIFPSLWEKLESLIEEGVLVAPTEVKDELQKTDDDLAKWAREHKALFVKMDAALQARVKEVLREHPGLVDASKTIPDADPFVIALALERNLAVVCQEKRNPMPPPRKIPDVCGRVGVECVELLELFRRVGWAF